jgi:hypothetical protein
MIDPLARVLAGLDTATIRPVHLIWTLADVAKALGVGLDRVKWACDFLGSPERVLDPRRPDLAIVSPDDVAHIAAVLRCEAKWHHDDSPEREADADLMARSNLLDWLCPP